MTMITTVITAMMNTGTMVIIMTAIGFIDHTDTTVAISHGGIHGGGIGFGGAVIGVITSPGISTIPASMWCGMIMDTGGTDHATGGAFDTACLIRMLPLESNREHTAYIFLKNHRVK